MQSMTFVADHRQQMHICRSSANRQKSRCVNVLCARISELHFFVQYTVASAAPGAEEPRRRGLNHKRMSMIEPVFP
jgi:hypothetical protein